MYYLRTKAAVDAIKFTVDAEIRQKKQDDKKAKVTTEEALATPASPVVAAAPSQAPVSSDIQPVNVADPQSQISCSIDNPDDCEMCGS